MRNLLLFTLLILSSRTQSQDYFTNTMRIGMEEGLSHYKVLSLYPDESGMYIGTADGLNHFDGFSWKYWKQDDEQLNFTTVDFIHQDQEGHLWLFSTTNARTKNDLFAIDILEVKNNKRISFSEKFGNKAPFELKDVQEFFEDESHQLYFFANQQLWKYNSESLFEEMDIPRGFAPIDIFSDGTLVGTKNKQVVLVSATGKFLFNTNYNIKRELRDLHVLGDHQRFMVWQFGQIHGHKLFVKQTNDEYEASPLPHLSDDLEIIHPVFFDKDSNQTWLYKKPMLHMLSFEGRRLSLPIDKSPRTACIDLNGNLWYGENGLTIVKSQEQRFKRFLYRDEVISQSAPFYRCRGLLEKGNELFINTYLGTKVIDLSNGKTRDLFDEANKKFVVLEDNNEELWFANREVVKIEGTKSTISRNFEYEDPSNADRIWSMLHDSNGEYWIGEEGLSMLHDGKIRDFNKYNNFQEVRKAMILDLFKDKNGVVWAASNNGLYQLDAEKGIVAGFGKKHTGKFNLPSNKFQHMYQDADGIYWLATEDIGLIKWDKAGGAIEIFDERHGLLSNNIYSIYEDSYGYLWMSSFNGIIRFDKTKEKAIVFTAENGITDNEFNRISHHQADDGYLYFGGQNGVTGFDPKDFLNNPLEQANFQLNIAHLSIFGKKTLRDTFSDGTKIDLADLKAGSNVIDLEIACSDIFWAGKTKLHYTLEQSEKKAFKNTSREFISADNHIELFGIEPGAYELKVKAIQSNGKQLGETLQVPIQIALPFFQTIPFWIGVFLIICICIWGATKYRTTQLRKREVELENQVIERTSQNLKNQKTIHSQAEQIAEMRAQLSKKEELWLEELRSIIHERLEDSNLDLPSIIENFEIGRSQFFEKVKSLTHMTPNQYIQEMRLIKAKEILESGEVRTVKEVAFSVGIRRPGYFSKLFKERFGILPSEYFRNHRN